MTIEETTNILDGILRELECRHAKVGTFYFATMDGCFKYSESKMFTDISDVASYLHAKSLTHGIFATRLLKSGDVSSVLFPLEDLASAEIDSSVIERFIEMK